VEILNKHLGPISAAGSVAVGGWEQYQFLVG